MVRYVIVRITFEAEQDSCFREVLPIKTLPTAVTVMLVLRSIVLPRCGQTGKPVTPEGIESSGYV